MSKSSAQKMNLKIYEHVYICIIYAYVYIKYIWNKSTWLNKKLSSRWLQIKEFWNA